MSNAHRRPPRFSISHILRRRRAIAAQLPVWSHFEEWEESCVPAYCHPNVLAASVSWLRLFEATAMARRIGATGPVLDFGSSIGEVGHLIDPGWEYHFIEQDDPPAKFLQQSLPRAVRTTLDDAPDYYYGCVFALDSLEHNQHFGELLGELSRKLAGGGYLILSGPTENWLYRLGRKVSGFNSHYHVTTVSDIENAARRYLLAGKAVTVPFGLPLFRISSWHHLSVSGPAG